MTHYRKAWQASMYSQPAAAPQVGAWQTSKARRRVAWRVIRFLLILVFGSILTLVVTAVAIAVFAY